MPQTTKLLPALWGGGAETPGDLGELLPWPSLTKSRNVSKPVSSHFGALQGVISKVLNSSKLCDFPTSRVSLVAAVATANPGPIPEPTATPHPLVFC